MKTASGGGKKKVSCLGASIISFSSVTLGKATLLQPPRLPPSSSSSSLSLPSLKSVSASRCYLTSNIKWKRFRLSGLPTMHIKTTKCNRFCLVASVTNQEVFNRPKVQVRVYFLVLLLLFRFPENNLKQSLYFVATCTGSFLFGLNLTSFTGDPQRDY